MPASRRLAFVRVLRAYATTTPGSMATTLFASSHCSRAAWKMSPPVGMTRSSLDAERVGDRGQEPLLFGDVEGAPVVARDAG